MNDAAGYVFFYVEANLFCTVVLGFLLAKDWVRGDRQERQILFDWMMGAMLMLFLANALQYPVENGTVQLPVLIHTVLNFLTYCIIAALSCAWLIYSEYVGGTVLVHKRVVLPMLVLIAWALLFLLAKMKEMAGAGIWSGNGNLFPYYFIIALSGIYFIYAGLHALVRAFQSRHYTQRKELVLIGIFPLGLDLSYAAQKLWFNVPWLCFGCTIFMLYLYLGLLELQISTDPLTGLNNRNRLRQYLDHVAGGEKRQTYILMLDLNKFKKINDTYGHPEGDRALLLVADALKEVSEKAKRNHPFIARFGGDEFVVVAVVNDESEIHSLCEKIRASLADKCRKEQIAYEVTTSIGYSKLTGGVSDISDCFARADEALYREKQKRG